MELNLSVNLSNKQQLLINLWFAMSALLRFEDSFALRKLLNLQNFETFKGFVPAITHVYTYVCVCVCLCCLHVCICLSTTVHMCVHACAPVCASMCPLHVRICVYTYHNHMYNLVFFILSPDIVYISHHIHCTGLALL